MQHQRARSSNRWRSFATLALLGLACKLGDATDSSRVVSDVASAGAANDHTGSGDAGSEQAASAAPPEQVSTTEQCPAPRGAGGCGALSIWARAPGTGTCCAYQTLCEAPKDWPAFQSLDDCQTSCRCASLEYPDGLDPATVGVPEFRVERTTLACGCASGGCSQTLEVAGATLCGSELRPSVTRVRGCGMVELQYSTGFVAGDAVFDEASGALIGTTSSSDTSSLPCGTFSWIAGREFSCADVQACQLCGQPFGPPLPACD